MATPSDKPVVLLVTGAWQPPVCYDPLKEALESRGYEVVVPRMPSMGPDAAGNTWVGDKDKVLEAAAPYFDAGREVALVAHSYGGLPATAATMHHGVSERAEQGLTGGFSRIVFLTAFSVPVRGWDLLKTFGGALPEWQEFGSITKKRFETSMDFIPSDITIPKAYIICEADQIIPAPLQEQMVQSAPGMKAFRLAAGHNPFLGKTIKRQT